MSSRFECPSASLYLRSLWARRSLWACLFLALALHSVSTRLKSVGERREIARPLTTRFVKRQPRLTKPLELKKRPRPRRRQIRRETVAVKARVRRQSGELSIFCTASIRALARPKGPVRRFLGVATGQMEPAIVAAAIEGEMQAAATVDMSTEMVDIDALDTGQYHAMVIQDPTDKRNVTGYFHLAIVHSVTMRRQQFARTSDRTARALQRLVAAMNRWTRIKSDVIGRCPLDSKEAFQTPWIYSICLAAFKPTYSEAANLGEYLQLGGFIYTDVAQNTRGAALKGNQMMLSDALATQGLARGKDWSFQRLPDSHPIYHVFFDFDSGPPVGGDFWILLRGSNAYGLPFADYLEGITIEGRLTALLSQKCYYNPWGDWGASGSGYQSKDPARALQFGVNTIIFALTQEGSITRRVMDSVSY